MIYFFNTYSIVLNIKERFKIIAVVVVPQMVHWAVVRGSKMCFKFVTQLFIEKRRDILTGFLERSSNTPNAT